MAQRAYKAQVEGDGASLYPQGGHVFYHFLGEYGQLMLSHLSTFFEHQLNC